MAIVQKEISLGVCLTSRPTLDLNHWRSLSISEISAMGIPSVLDNNRVRRSKTGSAAVSSTSSACNSFKRPASVWGKIDDLSQLTHLRSPVHVENSAAIRSGRVLEPQATVSTA